MLIGEYDYETDIRVQREEAYEEGVAVGEARGEARGETRGKAMGITIGESRGLSASLRRILQKLGLIPEVLELQIASQQDPSVLDRWIELALHAFSIEEFQKSISK